MRKTSLLVGAAFACLASTSVSAQEVLSPNARPVDNPPPPAQSSQTPPTPTVAPDASLGDIVVTASRRSETIRETPTAISAYSGDRLREAQASNLADLVGPSPNVQIGTAYNSANVAIRGIGNAQVTAGSDAGVAVHADGVYLGQPALTLSTFLDVARVEVLRGPQGTLFGRNATGGAINVVPNLPTKELAYGADLTVGVDPLIIRSSGYISGPLDGDGKLLARLSAQQSYNRGFTKNLNSSGPRHLDDADNVSVRGQLQYFATDRLDIRLLAEYQNEDANGSAFFLEGTPDPQQALPALLRGQNRGNVDRREIFVNEGFKKINAKTFNLTANWEVGGGNLKALGSYNDSHVRTLQDGDGTAAAFTSSAFENKAHQYYGELIYTSDASSAFTYILGANYFREKLTQNVVVPVASVPIPGITGPVTINLGGTIRSTSYAGFGRVQYEFGGRAKVFAGGRYTRDEKTAEEYNNFAGTSNQDAAFERFTYEVGASYDLSQAVSSYIKYATGYKGGGFSAGSLAPAFRPETNSNFEAGLKGTFLDGVLQANLAGFLMKYDDLQVNQIVGASSAITNAAEATINGIEAELVIKPDTQFRLELTGAYLDAKFDSFTTFDSARPGLGTLNLSGNRLPQAPKFGGSAGAYYDVPITDGTVTLGGRFDYKSRVFFSEFNIPVSAQDAAGKLDLSVRYRSEDRRVSASIFANNVTNNQVKGNVVVVSALLGSLALGNYQPGRQIGASVGYHF